MSYDHLAFFRFALRLWPFVLLEAQRSSGDQDVCRPTLIHSCYLFARQFSLQNYTSSVKTMTFNTSPPVSSFVLPAI